MFKSILSKVLYFISSFNNYLLFTYGAFLYGLVSCVKQFFKAMILYPDAEPPCIFSPL